MLRYLFGFRGIVLVAGAVDISDCSDCTAIDIEAYLATLLLQLDIDGDGELEPLTDGILILRYLFGFRGDVLVAGVVDTVHCSRCSATGIESYLATLTP